MTYVVKKPFRSNGRFYNYGDVVRDNDIANIKLFKSKVGFGKLIAIDEQNAKELIAYFKSKYGIDLQLNAPTKSVEAKPADKKPPVTNPAKVVQAAKIVKS